MDEGGWSPELTEYLKRCSPEYLNAANSARFMVEKRLYDEVLGTENTAINIESSPADRSCTWITLATTNEVPERMLQSLVHYLRSVGCDINQVYLNCIEAPVDIPEHNTGCVIMARLCVKVYSSILLSISILVNCLLLQ